MWSMEVIFWCQIAVVLLSCCCRVAVVLLSWSQMLTIKILRMSEFKKGIRENV